MPTLSKLAGALLLGALITQPAIAAEKAKIGGTVATVNGVPISQNIANAFISEQKAQGAPDSPELKNAVREELISRELLVQEA
ncbi:MAG TPA: peptidylprolyl isomerase, partial [Accumulibacter sp.]|nr:peptidylprolyl isomerase [Accumulibacter sp.]